MERYRWDGNLSLVFFLIAGKVTMRHFCFTSWASLLRHLLYPRNAIEPSLRPTNGRKSTVANFSMLGHCSFINFLTVGSTSVEFKTSSCERRELIISRIVVARLTRSKNTQSEIRSASEVTTKTYGASQRPMALAPQY